jgi:hypothetical protein
VIGRDESVQLDGPARNGRARTVSASGPALDGSKSLRFSVNFSEASHFSFNVVHPIS